MINKMCDSVTTRARIAALVVPALWSSAGAQTWDLATDWSDEFNPNGPWSYNGNTGAPIETNLADYDPNTDHIFGSPQPAWADAIYPLNDHVPVWFKRVSDGAGIDMPVGAVGMHGNEGDDPAAWVGVSWTSPVDASVDVSGEVWYAHVSVSRSADWRVRLNDAVLSTGHVAWHDGSTSASPNSLSDGSGGAAALNTLRVGPGDEIVLEFRSVSTYACFLGVGLTISIDPCPADLNDDGLHDLMDVNLFVSAFIAGGALADLAQPYGLLDLADVTAFVMGFVAGCP
jgi:hypothetical protein